MIVSLCFWQNQKNAWLNTNADDVNRKYEYWIDYYYNVVSLYLDIY